MCTCASEEHIYCACVCNVLSVYSIHVVVIIWGSFIVCCVYLCISLSLSLSVKGIMVSLHVLVMVTELNSIKATTNITLTPTHPHLVQ